MAQCSPDPAVAVALELVAYRTDAGEEFVSVNGSERCVIEG